MIIGDFGVYLLVFFVSKTLFTHSKNVAKNHNLIALGIKRILLKEWFVRYKAHSMQYRVRNKNSILEIEIQNLQI